MKRVPFVSIILENTAGEVLLALRENRSARTCPKHWTLLGGKLEEGEPPEMAARRVLEEEIGLKIELSFWKRYDREHPFFTIDQQIFVGQVQFSRQLLVFGRDMQFFKPCEIGHLNIGYGFAVLLHEYFLIHER